MLRGEYFLHGRPATAMSWREDAILSISKMFNVFITVADQCEYGLLTPSQEDKTKLVPAMKPTRFMTNSSIMSSLLSVRCKRTHIHQQLVGGRCKDAAFYPPELIQTILKGIAMQTEHDKRMSEIEFDDAAKIFAMPMSIPSSQEEFGEASYSSVPKLGGGSPPVTYQEANFRHRYVEEYTGELLPTKLIRTAIEDELNYFNSKAWEITTEEEMRKIPDVIFTRCRWVLCNKGDRDSPDVRARLVACELNRDGKVDKFSASTPPPLEGKKCLFTKFSSEKTRNDKPLRLSFIDIRKAYFNAIPEREIVMTCPKELGLPPNAVAKQIRCVYGTRDAGKLWEDTYTVVLMNAGFVPGASNPCIFYHEEKDISIVVHGDDFTALGSDDALDWYEQVLKDSFEIKIRGRLGIGCPGPQQIGILNRIVTLTDEGLTSEADPRHSDLLMSSLELTSSNSSATPEVKPHDRDELASKVIETGDHQLDEYSDPDSVIAAICRGEFDSPESLRASTHISLTRAAACASTSPDKSSIDATDSNGLNDGISKCAIKHSIPNHDHSESSHRKEANREDYHNMGDALIGEVYPSGDAELRTEAPGSSKAAAGPGNADCWLPRCENGVWARKHGTDRWNLDTPDHYADGPSNIESLAPMMFTIGAYTKSGETFAHSDYWSNSNAHASLRNQWQGTTLCFTRDCENIDSASLKYVQCMKVKMYTCRSTRT